MKAVIVEIKNGNAAVLSDDGCIKTIKNNNYEIGQVIQISSPKLHLSKKFAALAASAAALVVFSVGTWAYASPYSYVSVDVNPSIEYTLNRFNRVLNIKATNDDGEELLDEISLDNLKNQTIKDAITATVQQIADTGYFNSDMDGGIVITTSGQNENKAAELAQVLEQTVIEKVVETGDDIQIEAYNVSLERVEQAHELGVTPGKLNLIEKLQAASSDPTAVDIDEWIDKPVREIMKATKDIKKAASDSESANAQREKEQKNEDKNLNKADKDNQKLQSKGSKAADKEADITEKENKKLNKDQTKDDKALTKAAEKAEKEQDKAVKAADKAKDAEDKFNTTPVPKSNDNMKRNNKAPKITPAEKVNNKANQDNKKTGSTDKNSKSNGNKANNTADQTSNQGKGYNNGSGKTSNEKSNHGNSRTN
jgi:hypothetical protein